MQTQKHQVAIVVTELKLLLEKDAWNCRAIGGTKLLTYNFSKGNRDQLIYTEFRSDSPYGIVRNWLEKLT